MEFHLRRAGPGDLAAVMALETAGFPPGIVEDAEVFSRRIELFPEGFLLAVDPLDQAIGYICAEIWTDWKPQLGSNLRRFDLGHDLARWHNPRGNTLYVASMTVAPDCRGGVGRRLFRQGLARWAREFPATTRVVLIVNELWSAARRIYQTEGFREMDRLSRFFQPLGGPEGAALIMMKEITP